MEFDNETAVSEITIQPDGRVFVLGASRQVLEILELLNPLDEGIRRRLEYAGGGETLKVETENTVKICDDSTNPCQEEDQP